MVIFHTKWGRLRLRINKMVPRGLGTFFFVIVGSYRECLSLISKGLKKKSIGPSKCPLHATSTCQDWSDQSWPKARIGDQDWSDQSWSANAGPYKTMTNPDIPARIGRPILVLRNLILAAIRIGRPGLFDQSWSRPILAGQSWPARVDHWAQKKKKKRQSVLPLTLTQGFERRTAMKMKCRQGRSHWDSNPGPRDALQWESQRTVRRMPHLFCKDVNSRENFIIYMACVWSYDWLPILIAAFRPGLELQGLVATNPDRKPGLDPQSWQVEVAWRGAVLYNCVGGSRSDLARQIWSCECS